MKLTHPVSILPITLVAITTMTHADSTRLINTRDMYPSLSPNGEHVVFQSNRTGLNQIFLLNLNDGEIKKLTDIPGGAETPVFSPDGRHVISSSIERVSICSSQVRT